MARIIQINGTLEYIRNIQDIITVIRTYYSEDLASELENEYDYLKYELDEKDNKICDLENEIDELEYELG